MFSGRSAAYPQADTPTMRQVFGKGVTMCNHLVGLYWAADNSLSLVFADEQIKANQPFHFCPECGADLRVVKNTEQQVQADSPDGPTA